MRKNKKNVYILLLVVGVLLCLGTGFLLFKLMSIPFGFLFNMSFYLFIMSVLFVLLLSAFLCFKTSNRWIKIAGIPPLLISIILAFLTVIVSIDYRILYFRGLPPKPTKTEWIEDLHYLAEQMEEKHPDLYSLVSEESLTKTVKEIESLIPDMSDTQIVMELFRLTALPNDGHTFPFIFFPCFDLHGYPIIIYGFEDSWYIVDAGRSYRHLIGAKLVKIGSTDMEDIFHRFPPYLAAESHSARLERFTFLALMPEWLESQGIIRDIEQAQFTLEKTNREQVTLTIPSVRHLYNFYWTNMKNIDNQLPPVYTNPRKDWYWFELLEESKTLYIQFNQATDQSGRETVAEFAERLSDYISTHNFERCVVDIRNNDGGDSGVLEELTAVIRDSKKINQQGKLFVLIGRRTFSAAVMFAIQLQLQTKAIFIGEPTAQGPIFYGGPNLVELPYSRLVFGISSRLNQTSLPFDDRREIFPDIPVPYTYSDFMKGRDPVLEAALKYQPQENMPKPLPPNILDRYAGRYLLNPVQVMDVDRHGSSLTFRISDFIPGSYIRVRSDLYPKTERDFKTDIPNVFIRFPSWSGDKAPSLTLDWMGEKKVLQRAPDNFTLAMESFSEDRIEAGVQAILDEKETYLSHYSNMESLLNSLGYKYLHQDKIREAIQTFELNVKLFPDSYNVYDSLGEALLKKGDQDPAVKNYKKSLEINPDNENAKKVLEKLGGK